MNTASGEIPPKDEGGIPEGGGNGFVLGVGGKSQGRRSLTPRRNGEFWSGNAFAL